MACASEYKNPLVMTAQILSIVAFLLSFGWIWTYVVGFYLCDARATTVVVLLP